MDHRLIELLVCPLCKGPLEAVRDSSDRVHGLACRADHLLYPVRDGIPVMLESEALPLGDDAPAPATLPHGLTP